MSLLMENRILSISRAYYEPLMNLPNVVGVGMGYKEINSSYTNEVCLVVLVSTKVWKWCLEKNQIIPSYYMGVKTDVREVGIIKSRGLNDRVRPLEGGYAIGPNAKLITGTLGCIVVRFIGSAKLPKYYILSNNHILAYFNTLPLGTEILQTAYPEGGRKPADVVAKLSQFTPLKFHRFGLKPTNYADCAIAEITDKSLITSKIAMIGDIKGIKKPVLGMEVRKVGCTTALTAGHITIVGTTLSFRMANNKYATFKNQFIADNYNEGGDSGAVVVDKDNYVVGLFHAGTEIDCVFADISTVLSLLNVKMLVKK